MKTGTELITEERKRQITEEGWTGNHDDNIHQNGELALAACCYASPEELYIYGEYSVMANSARGLEAAGYIYNYVTKKGYHDPWPWEVDWDKRSTHSRLRKLAIAGALIAAEIDRLQREASQEEE